MLHNDPYRGGLHCPEHTFFKPFFVDGELLGFAVCIGHIAEIGGMVPGAFCGEATEIFHEGLRVPPVQDQEGRASTSTKSGSCCWRTRALPGRTTAI